MADNIDVTPGTGKTVATDEVGGAQYQLVKVAVGADGVATWVTSSDPFPVAVISGTVAVTGAVTASGTVAATQSGTWTVQPGNTANTTAWLVSIDPAQIGPLGQAVMAASAPVVIASDQSAVPVSAAGTIAHDAADSGNPVKLGLKASTSLAGLTLVANADRTDAFAGIDGVQIVRTHCNLEDIVSGNASNTDGTSTSVIPTAGSGIKQYLTRVILTNMSATGIYVEMKSATTVKATIPLPASSGATVAFDPPLPPNAANEAWNFDPSAAVTTVYCTAVGFKSKV